LSDRFKTDDGAAELAELRLLLDDPQVREFLMHYLSIPGEDGRAHLRRVAASMAPIKSPSDLQRQRRLGLAPRVARRAYSKG
jgi:hypothetical protein